MNDASPFIAGRISPELVETFTMLVCNGADEDAAQVVEQLIEGGMTSEAVMLDLFAPAARLMGDCWCEDRRDFMEVTLGLSRLQQMLRQFRLPVVRAGRLLGHALLLPVPGEQHSFGVRIVEEHLLRAGWKVSALLNPAEPEVVRLVSGEYFDFVGFSLTSDRLIPGLRSAIRNVRAASRNKDVRIVVGGVLFAGRDMAPSDIDADAIVNDAQEAVAQASEWALAGVE